MKIPMALASAVLLASTLAACGGGDGGSGGEDSDYCKDLKKASKTFGDFSSGDDLGSLDSAFSTFHKLADEAPSDIDQDWKKLDSAITTVEKALKDAGLSFADLEKIQKGQKPDNFDESKLQGLANEMTKLSSSDFTAASKAIEKHAKKTCKVNLNAS
jgi:hypothetical protein